MFQVQIDVRVEVEAQDVKQVEADSAQGFFGRFLHQFGADANGDSFVRSRCRPATGVLAEAVKMSDSERWTNGVCRLHSKWVTTSRIETQRLHPVQGSGQI